MVRPFGRSGVGRIGSGCRLPLLPWQVFWPDSAQIPFPDIFPFEYTLHYLP